MNQHDDELEHIHRVQYSTKERLAGLFVIIAAALLLASFAFSRDLGFMFADTFTLYGYVDNATDVGEETAVRMAGFEIGRVRDVEWTDDNRVRLTLQIREKFHGPIRSDSVATLSPALFGNASLEVTRGDPEAPLLTDGAQIRIEKTPSVDELMDMAAPAIADAAATVEQAKAIVAAIDPQAIARTTEELAMTMTEIRRITAGIEAGDGAVGRFFKDEKLAADVAATVEALAATLETTRQRLQDIEPLLEKAEDVAAEMPVLVEESAALAGALSTQLEDVNAGEEFANILVRLRSVLIETERTLRGIQNIWPLAPNMPEARGNEALPPQPPEN